MTGAAGSDPGCVGQGRTGCGRVQASCPLGALSAKKAARAVDPRRAVKPGGEFDPALRAASVETFEALVCAIGQLPVKHREVLRPYLLEGAAARDIARDLELGDLRSG